jgi:hypothetical protein
VQPWDQTWQVITTSPPWQWHFTTWLALLDHWQTLVAGVLALAAAFGTIVVTRCEDQRFLAQLEPILEGMRKAGLPEE